jgi:hypothetical protein
MSIAKKIANKGYEENACVTTATSSRHGVPR